MNTPRLAGLLALILAVGGTARAASVPQHMGNRSLIEMDRAPRLSLGGDAELLRRDITIGPSHQPAQLQATSWSAYAGIDLARWITLFGTAGAVFLDSLNSPGLAAGYDPDTRWSLGLNANLWHLDLVEPEYMRGRLSIGLTAAYTDYASSGDAADVAWSDTSVALPIGFEIPNEPMTYFGVSSLFLYAGPIYSSVDGDYTSGGRTTGFDATRDTGALVGLDIYASPNLSLGGNIQYLDSVSTTLSVRYHF